MPKEFFKPDDLDHTFNKDYNLTVNLNEEMSAEFYKEGNIWLHMKDMRAESIGTKMSAVKSAFKELANKLKEDPQFSTTEKISTASWLVEQNPKIFTLLGFTIDQIPEDFKEDYKKRRHRLPGEFRKLEPGYAYISKEDFLKLYGN